MDMPSSGYAVSKKGYDISINEFALSSNGYDIFSISMSKNGYAVSKIGYVMSIFIMDVIFLCLKMDMPCPFL